LRHDGASVASSGEAGGSLRGSVGGVLMGLRSWAGGASYPGSDPTSVRTT
jgi:hypothetical protein